MGYAEDKFMEYLRRNLILIESIKVDELLIPLSNCLSAATVEKLNAYVRNQGNRKSVLDFYLDLSRSDNWVKHFIVALRHCEHNELANEFQRIYSSYQRPNSSPRSLPPSANNYNQKTPKENPQCSSSLPGHMPPTTQDTQPSPPASQRVNQVQPEQEMFQHSPSHPNHEFRSLPPLPPCSPDPPPTQLPNNLSAPICSDISTSEDDSVRNPVPETAPYSTTPSKNDVEVPETRPSPSYSPSTSSDRGADNWKSLSLHDKVENVPDKSPASYSPVNPETAKEEPKREWTLNQQVDNVSDRSPASYHPENRKAAQETPNREWSPNQQVNNVPDRSPASNRLVNPETAKKEPKMERTQDQWVDNIPDRSPASYRPVNREDAQETPNREWSPNQRVNNVPDRSPASNRLVNQERSPSQQVPSGSSCRPLDNNNDEEEEEHLSKPGVLMSTPDFVGSINSSGASSELSHAPVLQISDCTERSESINAGGRSSTPIKRNQAPPVNTPNSRSIQIQDRRSPEENDFTFDSGRNRRLDESSSRHPEENSFDIGDVRHYRLEYEDTPEEDLMENNDSALRTRLRKTPDAGESNDQKAQENSKKPEGRDYERRALIAITVASLCLSLYLLWKSRNN
ncbi:mitochondrial antiviral-signaling protein isoform X2 [Hyla sarda]|uniref:mitochondrial antiviral-signaling protein isoform X2 n=1 Tax=Hyla sarda TaxID=327740 RepID=UPI0024C45A23|nr:mitochondrial antiviral-signaling protein isoform X2 [Hyla sarda]